MSSIRLICFASCARATPGATAQTQAASARANVFEAVSRCLNHPLLADDDELDATVLATPFIGATVRDRDLLTESPGLHPVRRDPLVDEILAHRFGAFLRKLLVE